MGGGWGDIREARAEVESQGCLQKLAKHILKLPSTIPFIWRPQTNVLFQPDPAHPEHCRNAFHRRDVLLGRRVSTHSPNPELSLEHDR